MVARRGFKGLLETALRFVAAGLGPWMLVVESRHLFAIPPAGLMIPLWLVLVCVVLSMGGSLVPLPVRDLWASLFTTKIRETHGSARFGTARDAARHLAPAAPADAFVLGWCATLRATPIAVFARMDTC